VAKQPSFPWEAFLCFDIRVVNTSLTIGVSLLFCKDYFSLPRNILHLALSVTNIPYDRWMRFMWKLFLIWLVTGGVMTLIAQMIHLGPM